MASTMTSTTTAAATASKFKVGDRVRMIRAVDGKQPSCSATILRDSGTSRMRYALRFDEAQVGMHGCDGLCEYGRGWWADSDDLELLPVATWKPMPGDRVRYTGKLKYFNSPEKVGHTGTVSRYGGDQVYVDWDNGSNFGVYLENLELLPAAKTRAAMVDTLADEYGPVIPAVPKLKVGDVVDYWLNGRQIHEWDGSVVTEVRADGTYRAEHKTMGVGTFCAEWLRPSTTAIVCLVEDGQPKPATRPYVHNSLESAHAEAARLASVHKGQAFKVFSVDGDEHVVAKPVYQHAWQTEAANGNKITAIKELRLVSDIGLAAAKNAVEDWLSRMARAA